MDKLAQIKTQIGTLIGTDNKIADEIIEYCQQVKTNNKILNMKSYVLTKLEDKTYNINKNINILEKYLTTLTKLKHKIRNLTEDCHHRVIINSSFKMNDILIELECEINEDTDSIFIIKFDGKTIIYDENWGFDYSMIKKDSEITNFNLKNYYKLDQISHSCALYGSYCINDDYDETDFDEKNYVDYNTFQENQKGVIDLKLFVEICKNKFADAHPIEMFDVIMLCLIYCYNL